MNGIENKVGFAIFISSAFYKISFALHAMLSIFSFFFYRFCSTG